jgi:class 3 adenylate cyclase/putative methionine-R-sulfoxide reductase with GAF domain
VAHSTSTGKKNMTAESPDRIDKRSIGRRQEDLDTWEQNLRYQQLFVLGQTITSEINMDALFQVIMDQTNTIMNTERSTIFLADTENEELWSLVATGMGKNEIRIPHDSGLAGWVYQNREPLTINDPYSDSRFNLGVDRRSGFVTRNILCVPVINRSDQCIGVLQALNSNLGQFSPYDTRFFESIADYVAIAVENARLYQEVKAYSEKLKDAIIQNENLEKAKARLTKFVPTSVAKLVDQNPDQLDGDKVPMDVSVLFLDIQGFTSITEGYDQLQVNDMVESHFSQYLDCVHRHGGELNETTGDGLMVIFKSDAVQDHAREAVSAGLEIIAENRRLNQEIAYPWGSVHLHMGINTGRAHVGATHMKSVTGDRWTYTASGMVTVLAARIGALSQKTQLYVGPETVRQIANDFHCVSIGTYALKNVSGQTEVFQVKRLAPGVKSHSI